MTMDAAEYFNHSAGFALSILSSSDLPFIFLQSFFAILSNL